MKRKIIPVAPIIEKRVTPIQGIRVQFHVTVNTPRGYKVSAALITSAIENWIETGDTGSKNVKVSAIEWSRAGGRSGIAQGEAEAESARMNLWGVLHALSKEELRNSVRQVRTGESVP